MVRIHPIGCLIIVIWCAFAVMSQNAAAAKNESELKDGEEGAAEAEVAEETPPPEELQEVDPPEP